MKDGPEAFSYDRTKRVASNAVYNFSGYVMLTTLGIVVTPYIVNGLGVDQYGIYATAFSILGYFMLIEMGVGTALTKYISELKAKNDIQDINRMIGTAILFLLLTGAIGSTSMFIIAEGLTQTLSVPKHLFETALFVFYLGTIHILASLFLGLFSNIFAGLQRFDLIAKLNVVLNAIQKLLMALVVILGYSLKEFVIIYVLTTLVNTLVYVAVCRKILPFLSPPRFDRSSFHKMIIFGAKDIAGKISHIFLFQLDTFLIAIFLPIGYVTFYAVPMIMGRHLLTFAITMAPIAFPMASELNSLGEQSSIKELYLRGSKLIFILTLPLALALLALPDKILGLWMGTEFAEKSMQVLVFLTLAHLILSITTVYSNIMYGLGRVGLTSLFTGINSALTAGLWLILIPIYGIEGAALAFLLAQILINTPGAYIVNKYIIKVSVRKWASVFVKPLLSGLILVAVLLYFKPFITSLINAAMFSSIGLALYSLLIYFAGSLDVKEKRLVKDYLRDITVRLGLSRPKPF
ncbi:MAG: flippase [archaeon]|nr:flippase [archaeon]